MRTRIRWKALPLILTLVVAGVVYFRVFLDGHLKWMIERVASVRNGAAVDIGALSTDFKRGELVLKDVEVGSFINPRLNLLNVDEVHVQFLVGPLLRKKIVVPSIEISGVAVGKPRKSTALLPSSLAPPVGMVALMNRMATGAYSNLRGEINDNPLKHLGYLSTGLDLGLRVYHLRPKFKAVREVEEMRSEYQRLRSEWQQARAVHADPAQLEKLKGQTARAPAAIDEAERERLLAEMVENRSRAELALKNVTEQAKRFADRIAELPALVTKDVAFVHYELGVPRLDAPDLTPAIFGPRLLTYLERLTYWVDLTRRRMPHGLKTTLWPSLAGGTSVHYAKASAHPTVSIGQVTAHSTPSPQTFRGELTANAAGLTTHPAMTGQPLIARLTASFPEREISEVRANVSVDHTGMNDTESLELSIGSFPLSNWHFYETGDLVLGIKKAKVHLKVRGDFAPASLEVNWNAELTDVEYYISAADQKLREVLEGSLPGIHKFSLTGSFTGPYEDISFEGTSELGQRLASALREGFRYELGALDDTIRAHINEVVEPKRSELLGLLRDERETTLRAIEATIYGLDDAMAALRVSRRHKG